MAIYLPYSLVHCDDVKYTSANFLFAILPALLRCDDKNMPLNFSLFLGCFDSVLLLVKGQNWPTIN